MDICLGSGETYSHCHIAAANRLCRRHFRKLNVLLRLSHFK